MKAFIGMFVMGWICLFTTTRADKGPDETDKENFIMSGVVMLLVAAFSFWVLS